MNHFKALKNLRDNYNLKLLKVILFCIFLCFALNFTLNAQQNSDQAKSNQLKSNLTNSNQPTKQSEYSVNKLKKDIAKVKKSKTLKRNEKDKIIAYYDKAIKALKDYQKGIKQSEKYDQELKNINDLKPNENNVNYLPIRISTIELKSKAMAFSDIQQQVASLQVKRATTETKLKFIENQLKNITQNLPQLRQNLSDFNLKIFSLNKKINNAKQEGKSSNLLKAKMLSMQAEHKNLANKIKSNEKKEKLFKFKIQKIETNKISTKRSIKRLEARLNAWKDILEYRKNDSAYTELRQANFFIEYYANNKLPASANFIIDLAKRNVELSKLLIMLQSNILTAKNDSELIKSRLDQMEKDYNLTKKRINMIGLNIEAGKLLIQRKETLKLSRVKRSILIKRRQERINIDLESDSITIERQKFLVYKNSFYNELDQLTDTLDEKLFSKLSTQAYMMIDGQEKLLEKIGGAYIEYLKYLSDQEATQKSLHELSNKYIDFINENLIWTKSSDTFTTKTIANTYNSFKWVFSISNIKLFFKDMFVSLISSQATWAIFLIIAIFITYILKTTSKLKANLNKKFNNLSTESILFTLFDLLLLSIRAAGIPIIICIAANFLYKLPASGIYTRSVCIGLTSALQAYIFIAIICNILKKDGIGEKHFKWDNKVCKNITDCFCFLKFSLVPLIFFNVMIQNGSEGLGYRNSLGRFIFIASMLLITFSLFKLFNSRSKLRQQISTIEKDKFLLKYHKFLYSLIIAIPIILIVISFAGYYFTGYTLSQNFGYTLWLSLCLIIIREILIKWFEISKNKALFNSNKQEQINNDKDNLDASIIDEQTSLLIKTILVILTCIGLYFIWEELFPVFGKLENIKLWTYQIIAEKDAKPIISYVTLSNLFTSLVVIICMVILVKTLPALMELFFVKKTKMDNGTRYAIGLISRYIITIFGVCFALSAIKIGWNQFSWLVAAMTFGLSFGLQEIFANFISGLIILIERPIRIGDVITIGQDSGTVSKIRIRSTTIIDWEKREVLVPNKSIITNRLINWTHSNDVLRIVIPIGVAYGTDTEMARELLLNVAKNHPKILNNPPPMTTFKGFGDSTLNLELRGYVNYLKSGTMGVITELNTEIDKVFKDANIEIAFPQLDVNLKKD